ncbi:unnamed protein product [Lupinus luteus]|uniref:Uncharacterized protein n=1 Tax=Lupinus luteus TaxID=3873 RepID=A0AAV1W632_LUPLU
MGKSLKSAARLQALSRIVSSPKPHSHNRPKQTKHVDTVKVEPPKNETFVVGEQCRTPLATVVGDCTKRWFQDTLKEAKGGDISMQVLIAQMYNNGYGVPKDPRKGYAWISKASRSRNSVWKVSEKQPGYRASDSDSCEPENNAKSDP